MTQVIERPEIVTEEHLEFLDELRDSGETNMWGAGSYLEEEFPELSDNSSFHSSQKSLQILQYWMKSFSERHPK